MNTIKQELLNKIEQLDIADLVIFNNYAHALSKRKDTIIYDVDSTGKYSELKFMERSDRSWQVFKNVVKRGSTEYHTPKMEKENKYQKGDLKQRRRHKLPLLNLKHH